ncbi:MAG: STAS domain-containing protein [Janthinobacterium lividum]
MLIVYHELLPDSYLLILTPGSATASELELAHHLSCAARSGKAAVWVDCRLVDILSPTAVRLLWACHYRLRKRGAQLVLCRVSAALAQLLNQLCTGPQPDLCLVDSLDEAAAQLHAQPAQRS